MKLLLKLIGGVILVVVIGSYLIDTQPVSNVLQTGQKGTDPLVAGAKSVKQELNTLTDKDHQEAYKETFKLGLKKAADVLNGLAAEEPKAPEIIQPDPQNLQNSL